MVINKIYSPITKTLTDYLLNPVYILVDFIRKKDFLKGGNRNILYFILNFIFSFIITICGCIYNEFIVLFCYKLEYNTHHEISQRASILLEDIIDDDNLDDD